jgi:hypothetical protein
MLLLLWTCSMAFARQLKLLLWKNFTLRKRQPVRVKYTLTIFSSCFLVLILWLYSQFGRSIHSSDARLSLKLTHFFLLITLQFDVIQSFMYYLSLKCRGSCNASPAFVCSFCIINWNAAFAGSSDSCIGWTCVATCALPNFDVGETWQPRFTAEKAWV